MRYGIAIQNLRTRLGLSQSELAQRCRYAQPTISQFESEQRRPSLDAIEDVAKAAGCSPIVIFLLAVNGPDLPPKPGGIRIAGQIARLIDDLWRLRRIIP